jgi:hypothetical protein
MGPTVMFSYSPPRELITKQTFYNEFSQDTGMTHEFLFMDLVSSVY